MPNDVKLQEGHPVDENLRPIKVGGKSTAIETAQHGNGARITGGLEVSGAGKSIVADPLVTNSIVSTDLTINDAGSISLDATSTDGDTGLLLKNAGTLIGDITVHHSKTYLTLYENGGASIVDYFEINVAANGATTISAVDTAGTDASLILDIDGSITLDSHTGVFIAKKAGTEFSVANSAYAGMILGYTTVGIDAADGSYPLTTSMVVPDSAHNVSFIAPPSGVVEIFVSIYADLSRRAVVLGLSDDDNGDGSYTAIDFPDTDDVTNEHKVILPSGTPGTQDNQINHRWVVTDLTPGDTYKWWLGAKSIFSGGALRWGGNISAEYAPFIMKATALPAAVTDFAVYG